MRAQLVRTILTVPIRSQLTTKTRFISNTTLIDVVSSSNAFTSFDNSSNKIQLKEWKKILTKAEKIVGYPTSFLNLRYLVSDEVANFASLFRKLMLTNHPLISTARHLITDPDKYTQINGLIVLLVSKASGLDNKEIFLLNDITDGIHSSQRCLAEIAEMINMASLIHNGILDLSDSKQISKDTDYGNKLAVLCGDFLLASACKHLANLNNTHVVDLMSQVIGDISQGIFFKQTNDSTSLSDTSRVDLWMKNLYRESSSLLANSCRASQLLVNHSQAKQENAYNFAHNLDITHRIWLELNEYHKDSSQIRKQNTLLNAIYVDKSQKTGHESKIDDEQIINDSLGLLKKHYTLSLDYLNLIRESTQRPNEGTSEALISLDSILSIIKHSFIK